MEEPAARQPHKAQLRPHPAPLAEHRALLCQFPTCHFPDWLSVAKHSGEGREFWGGAGSLMFRWLHQELAQG